MQRCSPEMQRQARETCLRQEGWQASAKPEKEDLDDEDDEPTCQEKMIDPNLNTPTKVATPDECLEVNFTLGKRSACSLCTVESAVLDLLAKET